MGFWDEFEEPEGDYPDRFKFETPGDSIVGEVTRIRVTDFGGSAERTPELWIKTDDGQELSVTASQTRLRRQLAEKRPNVGDRLAVVYTGDGESKRAGFSPPKLFDVTVKRADGSQAPADDASDGEGEPVAAGAPKAEDLI